MKSHPRLVVAVLAACLVSLLTLHHSGRDSLAQNTPPDRAVVIVHLQDQEQVSIARAVHAEYQPQLNALTQAVQQIDERRTVEGERPTLATREEEIAYAQRATPALANDEAREAHTQAITALEAARSEMRREILTRSAAARQASQDAVARAVEILGGEVIYRYDVINAMAVAIPPERRAALVALPVVDAVFEDGVTQSQMNISPQAIGADTWWGIGYDGGIWDVAVIDSGIDNTHPALASQTFEESRCLDAADYWQGGMPGWDPSADDVNGHGTHIAGTIASTNGTYRGIAHGLNYLLNGKAGFDLDGNDRGYASMYYTDGMACTDWALAHAADDADIINLSYGSVASSDDGYYERFWDAVVDQMDAVVTIAAGNDGPGVTIGSPSIAYNVISVANIDDQNTTARTDDSIWNSSSRGPTPSGRKKPDLAAPGSAIISTDNSWESTTDFVEYWGTSMAAPHVAGAATLMMDRGVTDPMAIKALLINTAEDRGAAGWDGTYGWGYIDLNHLDHHVSDYFHGAISPSPAYQLYAGPAYSGDLATLTWHRRAIYNDAAYPSTHYALTDLDLYLYDEADNSPLDYSISGIDNVEQVEAESTYDSVVIRVDSWSSSIDGVNMENYVLATEESFSPMNGPDLQVVPSFVTGDISGPAGTEIWVYVYVQNAGDLWAHNVFLEVDYSSGLTMTSGNASTNVGDLADGASSDTYYWYFEKNQGGPQSIEVRAISYSYGEAFTGVWQLRSPTTFLPIVRRD